MNKPLVYLTGAGPGDPELLTLKAKRVIGEADVIVYDSLISTDLLKYARKDCEIIYAGKRSSNHTLPQYSINELLAKKAKENKIVVRLKGGDPFLYGRGGEEAEKLHEEGIDFEIIPGISSSFAVPAYAGIPLTHRDYSSTVAIVTGHEGEHKEETTINWDNIAGASTIVVLMGYKNITNIINEIIKAGKDENTPAAVIQEGTTAHQKVAVGTLKTIEKEMRSEGLKSPLIFIVGEVVRLRQRIKWFEKRPLYGVKALITRSTGKASSLAANLKKYGAETIELPLIEIIQKSRNIDENAILKSIEEINRYDFLIFTSANAVEGYFERIFSAGKDLRILSNCKIISVGAATSAELRKYGIIADIFPSSSEIFSQDGIIKELDLLYGATNIKGKNFLFPQALNINSELPEYIISSGGVLTNIPVYETILPPESIENMANLFKDFNASNPPVNLITFTSYSTVENFIRCVESAQEGLLDILQRTNADGRCGIRFAAIGRKTAEYAFRFGIKSDIISKDVNINSLTEEIVNFYKEYNAL